MRPDAACTQLLHEVSCKSLILWRPRPVQATESRVDAFACPGRSTVRTKPVDPMGGLLTDLGAEEDIEVDAEAAEFIAGSPRRALEIANPFDEYAFIERNPARIAELEILRAEF